jgi:cytoskeletal protein CcmA (bactofilin family)
VGYGDHGFVNSAAAGEILNEFCPIPEQVSGAWKLVTGVAWEEIMFSSKDKATVIAKGLKIVGSVTADGLVEVNGRIEGELHGTSLVIARGAHVAGTIVAQRVVVDGSVEGPIQGGEVILKSKAHVVGDIQHQSLSIENGAYFEGRSM